MTKHHDVIEHLAQIDLFARCTKRDLRIVVRHGERIGATSGTTLVRQGDRGDAFFLVLSGTAVVERDGVTVAQLGPGSWFGELALLDPADRAATVTSSSDAELLALDARMFKVLLRELPGLSAAMLAALARRVREAGTVATD
jgi:CRP-like cAMP-binding protein